MHPHAPEVIPVLEEAGRNGRALYIQALLENRDHHEQAIALAAKARDWAVEHADSGLLVDCASILFEWGAWKDAAGSFESLKVTHLSPLSLVRQYMISLYNWDAHMNEDLILRIAGDFRKARGADRVVTHLEALICLIRGAYGDAAHFLCGLVESNPQEEHLRVELALAHFKNGNAPACVEVADAIKSSGNLPADDLMRVAELERLLRRPHRGLEFAYEAWRKGKVSSDINAAYVQLFFALTHQHEDLGLEPVQVQPGTAVTLRFDGKTEETFVIVEGTPVLENEITQDHEVAKRTVGLKVRDVLAWRLPPDSPQSAEIIGIRHMYVWAVNRALSDHPKVFPTDQSLQQLSVEDNLASVLRVLDRHEQSRRQAFGQYGTSPLPFAALGRLCGMNIYQAWSEAISAANAYLLVAYNTVEERYREDSMVANAETVVMDALALFTQQFLGTLTNLKHRFKRIIVPQHTYDELCLCHEWVNDMKEGQMTLGKGDDGSYFRHEVNAQQIQFVRTFLEAILTFCDKYTERPARPRSLTAFERSFAEVVGSGFLDAILVAQDQRVPVYSDDAHLRHIALDQHGVVGFSTPSLISLTLEDDEQYANAVLKLLRANYRNIAMSPRALLGLSLKRLTPEDKDVAELLDRLFSPDSAPASVVAVAGDFCHYLLLRVNYFGAIELFLEDLLTVYDQLELEVLINENSLA